MWGSGYWIIMSEFTKGELVGLTMLVCFSTQNPGVCHCEDCDILKSNS